MEDKVLLTEAFLEKHGWIYDEDLDAFRHNGPYFVDFLVQPKKIVISHCGFFILEGPDGFSELVFSCAYLDELLEALRIQGYGELAGEHLKW